MNIHDLNEEPDHLNICLACALRHSFDKWHEAQRNAGREVDPYTMLADISAITAGVVRGLGMGDQILYKAWRGEALVLLAYELNADQNDQEDNEEEKQVAEAEFNRMRAQNKKAN